MSDLIVRVGTPDDVEDCMVMADMGARENGMAPHDMNQILQGFWPSLKLDHGIVGIVGEKGGKPEGCVLLRVTNFWYGFQEGEKSKPMLEERWLWTHPDYRSAKGGRARKLCEFAKTSAERLGLPLMIGILSNIQLESKMRLYRRVFGEPTGYCWYIEPRAAPSDQLSQAAD